MAIGNEEIIWDKDLENLIYILEEDIEKAYQLHRQIKYFEPTTIEGIMKEYGDLDERFRDSTGAMRYGYGYVYSLHLGWLLDQIKKEENSYNENLLVPIYTLPKDDFIFRRIQEFIQKGQSYRLIDLIAPCKCYATYDFFCKNMTGKDLLKRLIIQIEETYTHPIDMPWIQQFQHPDTLFYAIELLGNRVSKSTLFFNFEYHTGQEYEDTSPDRRYRIVTDYRRTYPPQPKIGGVLKTKYIITSAKMTDSSIDRLTIFLKEAGYPFEPTIESYMHYLNNVYGARNEILTLNKEGKKRATSVRLYDLLSTFIPSKLKAKKFFNHTHIVGRSGSGKSELLKNIIKQVKKNTILIDPHGDIANSFDKKEGFIKIAPDESRFVINPFDLKDKSIKSRELVTAEIIELLEEMIQDTQTSFLMKTISFPIISTLLKLPYADFKMFAECINPVAGVSYLEKMTPFVDDHLQGFWQDLKTDAYDATKKAVYGRLQSFLNKREIVQTVCGYDDFTDAIKAVVLDDKNLVVSLPIATLSQEVSEVLGRFFMCRMQIWAKRRFSIPEKDRKPVLLIVDECQNYLSKTTATTLDQFGRKFGLYMTLAHQHIAQIEGRNIKGAIFANCKNKIVGVSDEPTISAMSKAMSIDPELIKELNVGNFYMSFEGEQPQRVYSRLVRFKTDKDAENTQYAPTKNTDSFNGWDLVNLNTPPQTQTTTGSTKTAPFTPKHDL